MKMKNLKKPLNHVAFIMDGNGRWAKKRHLERNLGHKEGCKRIMEIIRACNDYNIKVMSIYCFSTENWSRPKDEIDFLFSYLKVFFNENIDECVKKGIKIKVSGDTSPLNEDLKETIDNAIKLTSDNNRFIFNICLNYGSRQEILRACNLSHSYALENSIDTISKEIFESNLYTFDLPEIDLLIRTSGEQRLSNFLLYQLAYSEFVFTKTYWPSFTKQKFEKCLRLYSKRKRRFGSLKNS